MISHNSHQTGRLLVVPTQFGKKPVSFSYDERMTLVELLNSFRLSPRQNFKKYISATFYTEDLRFLRRPFAIALLLYWFAVKSSLNDSLGEVRQISFFTIVKMGGSMLAEWFLKFNCKREINIRLKKIKNNTHLRHYKLLIEKGKVIYIHGGQFSSGQAGGSIAHAAGVVNSFLKLGFSIDFWSGYTNPLLEPNIRQFRTIEKFKYPNLFELENLRENDVIINGILSQKDLGKPNFVYQRYSDYNYSGLILAQKLGIPLVLEFNSSALWKAKHWGPKLILPDLARQIELIMLEQADLIIVVSKALKDRLVESGVKEDEVFVNPNGVDIERFSPECDGSFVREKYKLDQQLVIGFIGTFGPWHGAEILAEAITKLDFAKLLKNVHFLFIGDGQRRLLCEDIIRKAGLLDMCTFTGMIPQCESPSYQAACDILVSPHVSNPDGTPFFGSPTKLFEYMAMGKVIIASKLEQIADILQDNVTAILVEPNNASQLASAITQVCSNLDKYRNLGLNARTVVCERYTWEQHAKKIIDKVTAYIGIQGDVYKREVI